MWSGSICSYLAGVYVHRGRISLFNQDNILNGHLCHHGQVRLSELGNISDDKILFYNRFGDSVFFASCHHNDSNKLVKT